MITVAVQNRVSCASSSAAIPLRVERTNSFRGGFQRVTAIELKWFLLTVVFPSQSCKRLHGSGGQIAKQFGEMGAAANTPHRVVQALAKSLYEVCANELPI